MQRSISSWFMFNSPVSISVLGKGLSTGLKSGAVAQERTHP
jgi:hypothetical protein